MIISNWHDDSDNGSEKFSNTKHQYAMTFFPSQFINCKNNNLNTVFQWQVITKTKCCTIGNKTESVSKKTLVKDKSRHSGVRSPSVWICLRRSVAFEQLPCVTPPQWCCCTASQESTLLAATSDLFPELTDGCKVKRLRCVVLFCVFTGGWDSQGQNANLPRSPKGTNGNAGTWGRALTASAQSGSGPDLVRAAFKKSRRELEKKREAA